MQIVVPNDCGNSPRLAIVSDFVTSWMSGARDAAQSLLADDATWELVGAHTLVGSVPIVVSGAWEAEHLEILSVINHGRTAACEGFVRARGVRTDFCHVFRFPSPTKAAKIASIRTFSITSS